MIGKKRPTSLRAAFWGKLDTRFLPFADAVSAELPLPRLLRLALFQMTVGMAAALTIGTLNRVMIVELHVPAGLVSLMIAIPLLLAPARALIGFRSDTHRSVFGWRRVPFIWFGALFLFGGLATMPFSLIVLSGRGVAPAYAGEIGAAVSFLMLGIGMHTVQTAGLALATDIAPEHTRHRVVAMLSAMLIAGMIGGALTFGALLTHFTVMKLVQVVQGAALVTFLLNCFALWKQEARKRLADDEDLPESHARFRDLGAAWAAYRAQPLAIRRLVVIGVGTLAFSMQDILLEPYGGQVLHLSVGTTTALTALLAGGAGLAFLLAGHRLARGGDAWRIAAAGVMVGLVAFSLVIAAAPLGTPALFAAGVGLIGFGGGLFLIGTLADAMTRVVGGMSGLALGAWGAVQALAAGIAIAFAGAIRDYAAGLAATHALGPAFSGSAAGYATVYHIEIVLLFVTLALIGKLVRRENAQSAPLPFFARPSHGPDLGTTR